MNYGTQKLSYWEYKSWFSDIDFTIIGSGIVGLTTAIHLKKRYPNSKILILEKGWLPNGASTKNAGFACFGSISEILSDLNTHSEDDVKALVKMRFEGLKMLRDLLGDTQIRYKSYGGYEVFLRNDKIFEEALSGIEKVNQLLKGVFNKNVFEIKKNTFGFKDVREKLIFNTLEGQIDTGLMMQSLLKLVQKEGILILNNFEFQSYQTGKDKVFVNTNNIDFETNHLLLTTNGFASTIVKDLKPARAQVLITSSIPSLQIKGTFHMHQGYYYFRNIGNRILFGGGRHLDFKKETTAKMALNEEIQNELERILRQVILPSYDFKVANRWTGIMGVGSKKQPIIKSIDNHVHCGVRLGGMGIAIGCYVGQELSKIIYDY